MKLLWAISNWKRTGPLEPSLDLAVAVAARGHDVEVAIGAAPPGHDPEATLGAEGRGLVLAETGALLHKHSAPWRDLRDARRLASWIRARAPDALIATQRSDHRLLLRAARGALPVIRLWFGDGHAEVDKRDGRALLESAGVMVFCRSAEAQLRELGVPAERLILTGPPLDLAALRARATEKDAVRQCYGIPEGNFLFGIVARMQLHRRFELLWEAVALLKERGLPVSLLAIGRGTNEEIVARRPVAEMGLSDHVVFSGYLRGEPYASALAALDAQVFLVPGSDPTCRALREGMALGVPSVSTRLGMLPEIVDDGVTGRFFDTTADCLAETMTALVEDRAATRALGEAARHKADAVFDARAVAADLERILRPGSAAALG